jgi:hypothetical protein
MSASRSFRAQASGVAHGSSSGRARRGAALEQELDHPALPLWQPLTPNPSPAASRGEFRSGANGRGQGRRLDFDVAGVDVGAGVQKDCRNRPVVSLRIQGSTPNFQHQPNSQVREKPVQGRGRQFCFAGAKIREQTRFNPGISGQLVNTPAG